MTTEIICLRNQFRDVLVSATQFRDRLQSTTEGSPDWVHFEREVMFAWVNRARRDRNLDAVDFDSIVIADRCATGHVDWIDKFPLYCAELVLQDQNLG